MSFLKVVGKRVRRAISRDPVTINAYKILKINALATDDLVEDLYKKLKKDKSDSNWLREVEFAYRVLTDQELRERHDNALKRKLGLEDLFFVETKHMGLELFDLKPHDIKSCTDKPIIRSYSHTESDVLFNPVVEGRFHEQCAHRLLNDLRVSILPAYADGLFAVVNYDSTFVPDTCYGQRFRDLTLVMACSCNIFVYVPKPIQFTLQKG